MHDYGGCPVLRWIKRQPLKSIVIPFPRPMPSEEDVRVVSVDGKLLYVRRMKTMPPQTLDHPNRDD